MGETFGGFAFWPLMKQGQGFIHMQLWKMNNQPLYLMSDEVIHGFTGRFY